MIDKTSIVKTLQLENMTYQDQLDVLNSIEQTIKDSKAREKEKLKTNVDFVVEALRNIKQSLEDKFQTLDLKMEGKVGQIIKGRDGANGKDGAPGKEGRAGKDGAAGPAGKDGVVGKDGISVTKAKVDIDGQLVITLSNGKIIEAGQVFSKSVSEKIRVFSNSDNRVPELVGQSGKFLTNDGVNLQWVAGGGGSMVYPGAGIGVSTGSAWGTSKATPSGVIVGDTDTQTLTNKTLTNPTITNYVETSFTANTSTAITIALTNGTVQNLTLTGSPTITMPTAVAGKSFIMYLRTGAGSYTVTWSTVKWAAGTAPTITSTASRMDIFSFFSDGTNWYGVIVGQNYTP
jgi:hypothetical protein